MASNSIFYPFHEIFREFDDEEKEHIHILIDRYEKIKSYGEQASPAMKKEATALFWVLRELKELDHEE